MEEENEKKGFLKNIKPIWIVGIIVVLILMAGCFCMVIGSVISTIGSGGEAVSTQEVSVQEVTVQPEPTLTETARDEEATPAAPTNTAEPRDTVEPSPTVTLLDYTLYEDKSYSDAGTFKVIWHMIITSNVEEITEDRLQHLMETLYQEAAEELPGEEDDRPQLVFIYLYTSEQHASSGMGQWIGMVSKSGGEAEPSFSINEGELNSLGETPELKFGYTEEERKEIWFEIIHAEDRADAEAMEKYPDMEPYDEYADYYDDLSAQYKQEVADAYELTMDQLDEIAFEGLSKNWPFPTPKDY